MGWIGTVGTIGAYVMLSRGSWHSASLRYAALNGIGGLLAAGASAAYGAWPSVTSNLLWSGVALHSAIMNVRARRAERIAVVLRCRSARPTPSRPTGPQPIILSAA